MRRPCPNFAARLPGTRRNDPGGGPNLRGAVYRACRSLVCAACRRCRRANSPAACTRKRAATPAQFVGVLQQTSSEGFPSAFPGRDLLLRFPIGRLSFVVLVGG